MNTIHLKNVNIFCCSDPAVQALQFLDVIGMKDPSQKAQFFRTTLTEVFPFIPRVNLFWIMHPTTTCWVCYPKEKYLVAFFSY